MLWFAMKNKLENNFTIPLLKILTVFHMAIDLKIGIFVLKFVLIVIKIGYFMSQNLPIEPPIFRWSSFFRSNYFIWFIRINKRYNLISMEKFVVLQKLLLIKFFCMNLVIIYLLSIRCVHFANFLCGNCQPDTLSIYMFYFYNKRKLLKI